MDAIQYITGTNGFGYDIVAPIAAVSHNQVAADYDTISKEINQTFFTKYACYYENFSITDYIDGDYFEIDNDRQIKISTGSVSVGVESGTTSFAQILSLK